MRRSLLILLLFWLPLQFAWGAAASFCQHEDGQGVGHFGHHTHKHTQEHSGKSTSTSSESTPDKKGSPAGGDFDCHYCHMGYAQPPASEVTSRCDNEASLQLAGTAIQGNSAQFPDLIERPKWTLAA